MVGGVDDGHASEQGYDIYFFIWASQRLRG